jgi:hypothetical protein
MTLEQALKLTLRGKEGSWGGHAKKPLSEIPYSLLTSALAFFEKLQVEKPDDIGVQIDVRALTLVIESQREHEEAKAAAEKEAKEGKSLFEGQQAGAGAPQDSPAGNTGAPASPASGPAAPDFRKPLSRWSAAQLQAYANQLLDTEPALQSVKHDYLPLMNGLLEFEVVVAKIEMLQKMIAESTRVAGAKTVDDSDLPF